MYIHEFEHAVKLTASKIGTQAINKVGVDRSKLTHHLQEFFSGYSLSQITGQCLKVNYYLKRFLQTKGYDDLVLTLGYVDTGYSERFKFDESDVEHWISSSNYQSKRSYHAWLTFSDMTILDVTFAATIASFSEYKVTDLDIIFQHADCLPSLIFHPVFVGEELAHRCGLIDFKRM